MKYYQTGESPTDDIIVAFGALIPLGILCEMFEKDLLCKCVHITHILGLLVEVSVLNLRRFVEYTGNSRFFLLNNSIGVDSQKE